MPSHRTLWPEAQCRGGWWGHLGMICPWATCSHISYVGLWATSPAGSLVAGGSPSWGRGGCLVLGRGQELRGASPGPLAKACWQKDAPLKARIARGIPNLAPYFPALPKPSLCPQGHCCGSGQHGAWESASPHFCHAPLSLLLPPPRSQRQKPYQPQGLPEEGREGGQL